MKLADLRKVATKQNVRVHFPLSNGMECVLNEFGVAQVPALKATADFNLEDELARAQVFSLEPVSGSPREKAQPRSFTREQMCALAASGPASAPREDHEE